LIFTPALLLADFVSTDIMETDPFFPTNLAQNLIENLLTTINRMPEAIRLMWCLAC